MTGNVAPISGHQLLVVVRVDADGLPQIVLVQRREEHADEFREGHLEVTEGNGESQ